MRFWYLASIFAMHSGSGKLNHILIYCTYENFDSGTTANFLSIKLIMIDYIKARSHLDPELSFNTWKSSIS